MPIDHIKQFGFPRWGEYGREREAEPVRMCDFAGCTEKGVCPAPKSPNSSERWYFCRAHAAEYNRNWDYFAGMSEEEMRRTMKGDAASSDAFASADPFEWGGAAGEDGLTGREAQAFDALELDSDAGPDAIKKQYRRLAKLYHPDANPGDPQAAERFQAIQQAYSILKDRPKS